MDEMYYQNCKKDPNIQIRLVAGSASNEGRIEIKEFKTFSFVVYILYTWLSKLIMFVFYSSNWKPLYYMIRSKAF